jgi:hypothetical protein
MLTNTRPSVDPNARHPSMSWRVRAPLTILRLRWQVPVAAMLAVAGCSGVTLDGSPTHGRASTGGNGGSPEDGSAPSVPPLNSPDATSVTSPPPAADASSPLPGATSAQTGTIQCGQTTCAAATEDCCLSFQGATCVPRGGACQGATLECTGSNNCSIGVCCGSFGGGGGGAAGTTCEPACSGRQVQLCATDQECPEGEQCRSAVVGLSVCSGASSFDGGLALDANFDGRG